MHSAPTHKILRSCLDQNQPGRKSDAGRVAQAEDHDPSDALPAGPIANDAHSSIQCRHYDGAGRDGLGELLGPECVGMKVLGKVRPAIHLPVAGFMTLIHTHDQHHAFCWHKNRT